MNVPAPSMAAGASTWFASGVNVEGGQQEIIAQAHSPALQLREGNSRIESKTDQVGKLAWGRDQWKPARPIGNG